MINKIPMLLKYVSCDISVRTDLSDYPDGISVDIKSEETVSCDVYSFGLVDQYGAMATMYIKPENAVTIHHVVNRYNNNEKIKSQSIETKTLSGWYSTLNTNLIPLD